MRREIRPHRVDGGRWSEAQETAQGDSVNIVAITRLLPQHYRYCVLKANDACVLRWGSIGSGIVCLENGISWGVVDNHRWEIRSQNVSLREGDVCGCGRGLGVGRQVWVCLENYLKDLKLQKDWVDEVPPHCSWATFLDARRNCHLNKMIRLDICFCSLP